MIPLTHRLKKIRDFNLLMQYGRYAKSGELTIRYLALARLPAEVLPKRVVASEFRQQLKCAFSVGLKVSKKAVERNRLRRRLREIIRLLLKQGQLRSGVYVLVIGHKALRETDSRTLEQLVRTALAQARLIHG